jgi:hypothetical protein
MSYYNLYYVNGRMGYFDRADSFDAMNDQEAVSIAARCAGAQPVELWCGGRLVQRFAPETAVPQPEVAA